MGRKEFYEIKKNIDVCYDFHIDFKLIYSTGGGKTEI